MRPWASIATWSCDMEAPAMMQEMVDRRLKDSSAFEAVSWAATSATMSRPPET